MVLSTACVEGDIALFGCPPDEVCSPATPEGLGFFGADLAGDLLSLQPVATARGGTQSITLRKKVGDDYVDLESAYVASGGGVLAIEEQAGPVVRFRAVGDVDSGLLEIRDPEGQLLDRKGYPLHSIARIGVVADAFEITSLPVAFPAGTTRIGIALYAAPNDSGFEDRMVDEEMTITLDGASRVQWDVVELTDTLPGTLTFQVAAGDQPATAVSATIAGAVEQLVDHLADGGLVASSSNYVCFDAVAAGHHVAGLTWSMTSNNGTTGPLVFGPNCTVLTPAQAGSLTLTVAAGGVTRELTYPVAAASSKPAPRITLPRSTPEGVIAAASASR